MSLSQAEVSPTLAFLSHLSPPGFENLLPKSPAFSAVSPAFGGLGLWGSTVSVGSPIATPLMPHLGIVTPSPTFAAAARANGRHMLSLLSLLPPHDEIQPLHLQNLPSVQERKSPEDPVVQDKSTQEFSDKKLLRCCLCDVATDKLTLCKSHDGDCSGNNREKDNSRDAFVVDGRFVCDGCRACFQPTDFEPQFRVCVNPLCRRKWKQLSPKVLPPFCPPCKRNLEESITDHEHCFNGALIEKMHRRWHAVFSELAGEIGYAEPPPLTYEEPECNAKTHDSKNDDAKQSLRWRVVLEAFEESFPVPPAPEEVRNWNSVHGRRKHYRGIVHRGHKDFICTIEAQEELQEDGVTVTKSVAPGSREYVFLDWFGDLQDEQEVTFIAFPNPAVSEREHVSRIIKILDLERQSVVRKDASINSQEDSAKSTHSNFAGGDLNVAVTPATIEAGGEPPNPPIAAVDAFADSFGDLMQWSTGEGASIYPATEAQILATRARDNTAGIGVNGAAPYLQASSEAALRQAVVMPLISQLPTSAGHRPPPRQPAPARAAAVAPMPLSVVHRSPGWLPRSPFASYFGD